MVFRRLRERLSSSGRNTEEARPEDTTDDLVPESQGQALPEVALCDLQYDGLGNVLFRRKRFAVSLEWEPLLEADIRDQANQARRSQKGWRNLYVRHGQQIGFASLDRQHKRASPALITAARSDLLGPRWIGAFKINEADRFWWIAGMRDGEIYEDAILADEDEARSVFMQSLDAPDWTSIIAPEAWQVTGSMPGRIEQAFDFKAGMRLRTINETRDRLIRITIWVLMISSAGGAAYLWNEHQKREAERLAEIERMRDQAIRIDPLDYPWARSMAITSFVALCADEIARSVFIVSGWSNNPVICMNDRGRGIISTSWSREDGRISWLRAAVPDGDQSVMLHENGNRAEYDRTFAISMPEAGGVEEPWSQDRIFDTVTSRFQSLGLPVNLQPRVRNIPQSQRSSLTAPVYNRHDLSLETSVAIDEYARLVSDIPALVPQALIYNVDNGAWSLSARIYHPPILPLPRRQP